MTDIRYKVKLSNWFVEPYWQSDDMSKTVSHTSVDEYVTSDEDVFKRVLYDFIDAPSKKMSLADIKKDFGDLCHRLSDNKAKTIATYYNGRLSLKKKITSALKKINFNSIDPSMPIMMKFNIPFELNYFSSEDDDICDSTTKQIESYIEIEISNEGTA